MNRKLSDMLEVAGIVHMLEFRLGYTAAVDTYLRNVVSAISGESSGPCSTHSGRDFYNPKTGMLEAIPGSVITGNSPIGLFDSSQTSNVGLLIDPKMVEFSYISFTDLHSEMKIDYIEFSHNLFNEDLLPFNIGEGGTSRQNYLRVPIHRSAADRKGLEEVFKGRFLDEYKMVNGKYDLEKYDGRYNTGIFPHNEVGVNFFPKAVKGLVIYSKNSTIHYEEGGVTTPVNGVMLANLFVEMFKGKTGTQLPIIHYDLQHGKLNVNEVELEPRKVVKVLTKNNTSKRIYEHYLDAGRVQDIILGKSPLSVGGPQ